MRKRCRKERRPETLSLELRVDAQRHQVEVRLVFRVILVGDLPERTGPPQSPKPREADHGAQQAQLLADGYPQIRLRRRHPQRHSTIVVGQPQFIAGKAQNLHEMPKQRAPSLVAPPVPAPEP